MNLSLYAYRFAAATIPRLPYPAVEKLSAVVGLASWAANRGGRWAVRSNLCIVLGREPSHDEVMGVFMTAASNYCDLFFLPRLVQREQAANVTVDGWEYVRDALSLERGAIFGSLHLGNLEVVGYAAIQRGVRVMLPVERIDPPELLDLMQRARRQAGFVLEPVGTTAFDRIRDALRQNDVVGIGVDRLTLGNGVIVSLCGQPARMPFAAALLALRTGAPLLPIAVTRLRPQRYHLRIGQPLDVTRQAGYREDVQRITQHLLDVLTIDLRANPTQWVVFRPVWNAETTGGSAT